MKQMKKTNKKQAQRRQGNYNYLMNTLKGWDGYSLLEFYVVSKTGNNSDIDKIPCWILDAFDELPEVINKIHINRLTPNSMKSLDNEGISKSLRYYHITSPENVESILKNGLKANEQGDIFIFQYAKFTKNGIVNYVDDYIANNQKFYEKYARIEIDPEGISVPLINDNVGESTSKFQWIVKQERINPDYLRLDVIKENGYIPCSHLN
jgi:hypothetical protein